MSKSKGQEAPGDVKVPTQVMNILLGVESDNKCLDQLDDEGHMLMVVTPPKRRRANSEIKSHQIAFYSPISRGILKKAKIYFRTAIMVENAFPETKDHIKFAIQSYLRACEKISGPNGEEFYCNYSYIISSQ